MESPYRTPATMPEEEKEMDEKAMLLKVWKMVLITIATGAALIAGCNVASTVHNNQTELLKIQLQSTPAAVEASKSRYLEAKALSDKAMFEEMARHPPAPAK